MTTPNFFVIEVTGRRDHTPGKPLRGSTLRLSPMTYQEAREAIAWQAKGGFDPDNFIIASPVPELIGVMEYIPEGSPVASPAPVLVENDWFTDAAWKKFLIDTWGKGKA